MPARTGVGPLDKHLLEILCCPETRVGLRHVRADELEVVNRAILCGALKNAAGETLTSTLVDALITVDGRTLYRIEDDIPVMLINDSVNVRQLTDFPR